MKQSDYYCGHLITTDGKWYIAHHGGTELRALTRPGIELLIDGAAGNTNCLFFLADYHMQRVTDLLLAQLGKYPTGDEENALLIQVKKTHARLIQVWKKYGKQSK